jgi:nicotinamide-nucleotide amidase
MDNQIHVLAERAGRLTARHKIMLVTAESCTGGWIAEAITSVAGSSGWFERGFVSYSNQAKQDMLGVSSDTLARFGAVSEEVVLEMARGAVQRSKAHLSVAVSGIAGPDGGTADKPVGTVWIAWGQKRGYAEAEHCLFSGDRHAIREQTVIRALQGLIARLGG